MKIITKFVIGDLVEYFGYNVSCENEIQNYEKGLISRINEERQLKVGEIYKVVAIIDENYGFFIDIQGKGYKGDYIVVSGISSSNFNKINKTKIMKITNLVKKILDKDTRTLIKAGFINGDIALTEEGVNELIGILFLEKKAELLKVAEEKLNEDNNK